MENNKPVAMYNSKTMLITLATVGTSAYVLGKSRGMGKGYIQGLNAGIKQGIAEGKVEGYVNALSDVASIIREVSK